MRIEFVDVPEELAYEADRRWPDSTWSEVIEYALGLLVDTARRAHEQQPDEQTA